MEIAMLIESLSGVRGYDLDLTEEVVKSYAHAFTEYCTGEKLLLGRDTRPSGKRISDLMIGALRDAGKTVIDLSICPTPTVQFAVSDQNAAGGIVITASHNPLPWNGLKFIGSDGIFLDGNEMLRLKQRRIEIAKNLNQIKKLNGSSRSYDNAIDDHIQSVLNIPYINQSLIRKAKFRVVADAVNGAGYRAIPELLSRLGCTVIKLNCSPDKPFPRSPEPLPENLSELSQTVLANHADLGLAVDPDGDRLAIVSDSGEPVCEEYTLVLAELLVLSKSAKRNLKVVTNLSTTMEVDNIAQWYNAEVIRTPIGEINVVKKMQEVEATIGGEGNGGVILPEAHLGRDSLVGTALVLQLLAEKAKPISELMRELPRYEMIKLKVPRGDLQLADIVADLKKLAKPEKIDTQDGIKFIWSDHWVHLRPSNTEPIIRIYAEAVDKHFAEAAAAPFVVFFNKYSNRVET
jgi:phosphomannomutase